MKYNFIVIGCGGTGSKFLIEFGRYLYGLNLKENYEITIIDGDTVEERNIARQTFQKEDIGRFKAEVMSEILSQVFKIKTYYIPDYIKKVDELSKYISDENINIIIACVDNHPCRAIIHQVFITCSDFIIYLDSANGEYNGEVVIGAKLYGKQIFPDRVFYYPEVLTDKDGDRNSCSYKMVKEPQQLIANLMAANILMIAISELIKNHNINGGVYLFNVKKGYLCFRPYKEIQLIES